MVDFRPVVYALGILIVMLGGAMFVPALVDIFTGNSDWIQFTFWGVLSLFIGLVMVIANRGITGNLSLRQAFLLTVLAWIVLPAVAALPLWNGALETSYTDAYFEAMSGLSTTGSTILSGLDTAPPGLLLWRALLQWLGGIGIIVMAVAILPMLRIGGMQLFKMESSDRSDKVLPRTAQIAGAIGGLYVGLTALCMVALIVAGLTPFDAVAHAFTTIATGGFSTKDASIGHFDSGFVDGIVVTFMILGSLPFVLYLQVLRGRPIFLWRDEQARFFLLLVVFLVLFVTIWLSLWKGQPLSEAFRFGSFNIISLLTGTGFSTTNYGAWGSFSVTLFFSVMFIGGCAGSTSCGVKIFRFVVLFKAMRTWMDRMITPNGVFIPRYNGRPISEDVISSVISFMVLFLICFLALTGLLMLTGLDWITAFSGAGTALANVGPGLGDIIGPAGNFVSLPDSSKWLLAAGMLLGRLELFSVLVLLSPAFWRA